MKLFLVFLLLAVAAHAQAPSNGVMIGPEGITITACSTTACTYDFGATGKYNTVAGAKYPLVVSCSAGAPTCNLLGGDPTPGTAKSIYAMPQAASYTVTWTDAKGLVHTTTVAPLSTITLTTLITVNGVKMGGACSATLSPQ